MAANRHGRLPESLTMPLLLLLRVNFADSHETVYKSFKIKELPPPPGAKENELRYAISHPVTSRPVSLALPFGMNGQIARCHLHLGTTIRTHICAIRMRQHGLWLPLMRSSDSRVASMQHWTYSCKAMIAVTKESLHTRVCPAPQPQQVCVTPKSVPGPCRVIRRIAVPNAMSAALPKDTIHYGCEIASASLTPTGTVPLILAVSTSQTLLYCIW